jgi:histidine triad (HIT) family protein
MDKDCLFCKIVAGEIPADKVFEDEDFIAVIDIKPVNLGHVLLIPKAHYRNLLDLPADILDKLGAHLQKLSLAVKQATGADGINIGMNNEPAAGQLIFHQHSHIMPRFTDDGFRHWQGKEDYTPEDFKKIAEEIKKNLK